MRRLIKSRNYLMKCLGFVLLFGFISLGAIGGCNDSNGAMTAFLGIHQTGQTTSHTDGDDGELQEGVVPPVPRFTDNDNGTITDNLTGFLWSKDAGCFEETTWQETLDTISTIGDGDCGLTDGSKPGDWKIANIRELHSLIDYGNDSPSLPAAHPFIGITKGAALWSSTSAERVIDPNLAFILDLDTGEVILKSKEGKAGCMFCRSQDCILEGMSAEE